MFAPHPRALIVTLDLDPDLHDRLTAWRTRLFPPERNYLDAHVTLFHALPGDRLDEVRRDLRRAAARAPFAVAVPGPFSLGRGVALDVVADEINQIRRSLHGAWRGWLTPQDAREKIRPHVTVQNKVDGETARRGLATVRDQWDPRARGYAVGLGLWWYDGGPWAAIETFAFTPDSNPG